MGITVRGVLEAEGRPDDRIVMTAMDPVTLPPENRTVRLVDGPNIQEGLIQVGTAFWAQITMLKGSFLNLQNIILIYFITCSQTQQK